MRTYITTSVVALLCLGCHGYKLRSQGAATYSVARADLTQATSQLAAVSQIASETQQSIDALDSSNKALKEARRQVGRDVETLKEVSLEEAYRAKKLRELQKEQAKTVEAELKALVPEDANNEKQDVKDETKDEKKEVVEGTKDEGKEAEESGAFVLGITLVVLSCTTAGLLNGF